MSKHSLHRKFRYTAALLSARNQQRHNSRSGRRHGPLADPTRGQGRILATLKLQDGIATKDLAFILGMQVASLNEMLAKLDDAGLITREAAEDDRRIILIRLTEAGRNTEQQRPQHPKVFASLSEEEQVQLGAILDKLIAQLEAEAANDAPEDRDFEHWGQRMRARMGDEKFERWMDRMAEYSTEGVAWQRRHRGRGRPHRGPGGRS